MDEALYIEKLAWFKRNEKPEAVLMIANKPELIKIIICWSNLKVLPTDIVSEFKGGSENEIWDWLWKNTQFSLAEIKAKTGSPYSEQVLEQKMKPLIGNRVLYPDSTVNSFVQRYLRGEVVKLFEAKPTKSTKNKS